jgi:3',5'-cyclic AMP phosphodiesterase CpdA
VRPLALGLSLSLATVVTVVTALVGCARDAHAGPVSKGPWLQGLSTTEVTIKLELREPSQVTVTVTGPKGPATRSSQTKQRLQALFLDGLEPSTSYGYVVRDEAGATLGEGSFTTAPSDGRAFSFLAYGDSRTDPDAHRAVVEAMRRVPSDFLVNTGDMVALGDDEDDWRVFFQIETPLLRERCVFAAVGNHELTNPSPEGGLPFLQYFAPIEPGGREASRLHATFRWGNSRFFLLNAMDAWTGDQKAWLTRALEEAKREPGLVHRFALMHHGPYSSGPHGDNKRLRKEGIIELLRDGGVELVLAGHDHAYERGEHEGLRYLVTGGAGAPLYPKKQRSKATQVFESVHHFVKLAVDGERVTATVHKASGGVLETCTFGPTASFSCEGAASDGARGSKGDGARAERGATADLSSEAGRASCACELSAAGGGARGGPRGAGALASGMAALALLARRRRARLRSRP